MTEQGNVLLSENKYLRIRFISYLYLFLLAFLLLLEIAAIGKAFNIYAIELLISIAAIVSIAVLILFLVFYSIWLHAFHRDIKLNDPEYPISPGHALMRFWIPVYNVWGIWNLHKTYCQRLLDQNDMHKEMGKRLQFILPFFYAAFIIARGLGRALMRNSFNLPEHSALDIITYSLNVLCIYLWIEMMRIMQSTLSTKAPE
jgi:hypothetical protein